MYNGKFASGEWTFLPSLNGKRQRPSKRKKEAVLLWSVVTLLIGATCGTVAYVVAANQKENIFQSSCVACAIEESVDGRIRSGVKIKNIGNTDAYIRAALVVTWQDADGNACSEVPVPGTDYTWTLNISDGWFDGGDGYYYFRGVVPKGRTTPVLIDRCASANTEPDGYTLTVEILADAIQSLPSKAVTSCWAVGIDGDGMISK